MSQGMTDLTVLVITYNEQIHIRRCLESVLGLTDKIYVVDSFSTDDTAAIAEEYGARVFRNPFVNHADQINWALNNCGIDTGWVLRIDADEFLLPELCEEIRITLPLLTDEVSAVYLKRRVYFFGRWIRHGAYYPIWILRIWRHGRAICEQRLMDEHMRLLDGNAVRFNNDLVDENRNNLSVWTAKHNGYATKEAVELLLLKYDLLKGEGIKASMYGSQEQRKRWLKSHYAKFPLFLRPVLYFLYRYFLRLGFLDGKQGLVWHFLQGFWYRFLVDAKLMELEKKMKDFDNDPRATVKEMYGIEID